MLRLGISTSTRPMTSKFRQQARLEELRLIETNQIITDHVITLRSIKF